MALIFANISLMRKQRENKILRKEKNREEKEKKKG